MSTTTSPAIEDLLDRAEGYPTANGTTGFMYSAAELIALLGECSPRITVGVHDIQNHGDGHASVSITVYASFARSELTPTG